jgi:mRNA export factor
MSSTPQTIQSPLKWQTRVVSCFTSSTNSGFAIGSIEGRVAIQSVSEALLWKCSQTQMSSWQIRRREGQQVSRCISMTWQGDNLYCSDNFSFKCHRRDSAPNIKDQALVFAVNDISFHPVHGTFSTCGQSLESSGISTFSTYTQDRMVSSISGTRMHVRD